MISTEKNLKTYMLNKAKQDRASALGGFVLVYGIFWDMMEEKMGRRLFWKQIVLWR